MASRFIEGSLPTGRNTLDVPVAALAGLSVAFAAFAAPADLLAELVSASGLAGVIPGAEPPLGMNARLGIGAAGAVLVFTVAFVLLRWLDRFGRPRARREEEELEAAQEPPRLRRRDFHPDAPARRPILATEDLSEPEARAPLMPEPEPEISEPEAEAEPVRTEWLPEPEPMVAEPVSASVEAEPAPRPAAVPAHGSSIPELLARLEEGLARRRADPVPPSAAPAPAQAFPEPADDRLQSAIDSLQRLAARQD